jgi:hypothetical protein
MHRNCPRYPSSGSFRRAIEAALWPEAQNNGLIRPVRGLAAGDELDRLIIFTDLLMRAQYAIDRLEHVAHAGLRDRAFDDDDELRLVG